MIIFHGSTKTLSSFLSSSFICCVIIFGKTTTQARIQPLLWSASYKPEKTDALDLGSGSIGSGKQFDYIQSVPNVNLILPSRLQNSTNPYNILLHKSGFDTVRLNLQQATSNNKWIIKIYGEGTEHKFPPFLERIIQRIQTYFSVYKYTDTSEVGSSTISLDSTAANDVVTKENLSSLDTTSVKEGISNLTQPLNSLKDESTVQENNADLIEFIAIGEYDDDYKVMAED
ncbi:uncharacterized protein LOC105232795 [Bactrocera dorsalis]|uniref:Uncharacterized protein LOC105232795 n=1 Tax=Bactrocera dorsalis TaxID=27457 RepID=A0A034VCQ0_BACDO|nr:uncharacterized protein LOC105232795 [Bactrocera dorsalis]